MARRGRRLHSLTLTTAEQDKLALMARRPKTAQRDALRARIVLLCAAEHPNQTVARRLGVSAPTVGTWRERFRGHRLEGLRDEPRPGAPRSITDAQVEAVVTQTLERTPRGQTHWSRRTMARAVGLSADSIGRIWQAFGLKPHLTEPFKLSPDPYFVEKVRDIVGLYLNPPEHAIVLCLDEQSQVQALDRTQPLLPLRPGQVERRTHGDVRHGTTSLFAALNVRTGETVSRCVRRHRHQEFLRFLDQVDAALPADDTVTIHLVVDNYGTHKTPRVKPWFARHPRYRVHFTPTSASWLNLVERLFAEVTEKAIRRGAFRSVPALERAIAGYLDARNTEPTPFVWTVPADLILDRVRRFGERISRSGH